MKLISDKTLQEIEKALGLDLMDEEKASAMMTNIITLICGRAGMVIMQGFNVEETEEFSRIPQENLEEMENFILAKNPGAREIFEAEAQKAKAELMNIKF